MSADKYPSIFSRQMMAIVYIFEHFLSVSRKTQSEKKKRIIHSFKLRRRNNRIMIIYPSARTQVFPDCNASVL